MFSKRFGKSLMMAFMALFAWLATGCICWGPTTRLNVTVALDPALRSGPDKLVGQIQVDIVAINPNEDERWRTYPMTKYWEPNDPMRKFVPLHTTTLDADKNPSQTLPATDPIWYKWLDRANAKDPPKLYILAQIRGRFEDKPGVENRWRQILPLVSCRWNIEMGSPPNVRLIVKPTGLITVTQPK